MLKTPPFLSELPTPSEGEANNPYFTSNPSSSLHSLLPFQPLQKSVPMPEPSPGPTIRTYQVSHPAATTRNAVHAVHSFTKPKT